jgi:hypothetical protein
MATISKTGIQDGSTSKAEHLTRIIDALDGTATTEVVATGSFTGSFQGDGSGLTGIVSSSYATTASYVVGGGSEYMTLRLTTNEKLIDTTTSTFYLGSAGVSTLGTRTGLMIPYDCTIVSASVYTNATLPSTTTSTLSFRLFKNIDTAPVTIYSVASELDLEQYFDGDSGSIGVDVSGSSWINLGIDEDDTSTCEYFVTCDVLIKKI